MPDSVIGSGSLDDEETYTPDADEATGVDDADETDSPETEQQGNPQADWENRFKGLQATVQTYAEQLRAAQQQNQAMQAMVIQTRLADLPEEDRQAALVQYQKDAALAALQHRAQTAEATNEELGKIAAITHFSQKYGVKAEELAPFNDPESMEHHARAIAQERRKAAKAKRAATGADRFEGGTAPNSAPGKKPKTLEEAAAAFAKLQIPRRS